MAQVSPQGELRTVKQPDNQQPIVTSATTAGLSRFSRRYPVDESDRQLREVEGVRLVHAAVGSDLAM